MKITNSVPGCWIVCFLFATAATAAEAPLRDAHVSQVFEDVKLMESNVAARKASINDAVKEGTAVRTGSQSRAELTFADLTITRLGENTVFSYSEGAREARLELGSVLIQVRPGAEAAKIKTAAVTAAVSGGTAMFGAGPPAKFMVLEGVGTFYPIGHPEDAVTLHGGEMVTLGANGRPVVQTFNVKAVMATSHLVVGFSELANLPLIMDVETVQDTSQPTTSSSGPPQSTVDQTSQAQDAGAGGSSNGGTPGEFGPPSTITSPDPYVIGSGTAIQTDPTITTNGVTDFGTLYRGTAQDGTVPQYLFGEAPTAFDQMVFSGPQNNLPVAVFKFQDLELTGDPTITVPSGATTNLALVSVGDITSGSPGGTLTFAGIQRLDFITQNGSINLGSEISFSGIDHLTFYARGSGNSLTLASPISGGSVVHLYSEGDVNLNGAISVTGDIDVLAEGNINANGANTDLTADNYNVQSLNGDINIDGSKVQDTGGSVTLNAAHTLNLAINGGGTADFDTFSAQATTINLTGSTTFDFSNSSSVTFTAGSGGINASSIDFVGTNLTMASTGDVNARSISLEEATQTVTVTANGLLNITGDLFVSLDKSNLGDGGNIVVGSGGNFTVGGAVTLQISADAPSGAGGDITVNVGGNLSSGNVSLLGQFATANPQGSGENVTLQVTGNLTAHQTDNQAGISLAIITPVNQTVASGANAVLDVGGNVITDANADTNLFINNNINEVVSGSNITATIGGTLTSRNFSATILNEAGTIGTGGVIDVMANGILLSGSLTAYVDNLNGSIGTGGTVQVESTGAITVGGDLHVLGEVIAGSNITAGTVSTSVINAPNAVLTETSGGIHPFVEAFTPGAALQHTFNVDSIIAPDGIDFSGNQFGGIGGLSSGGKLTINANTLTFDAATGIASANFNGADAGAFGDGNPPNGGDGGVFIVNTTGNITANAKSEITATTGLNSDAGVYSGAGGSVTLLSTGGMVTVNNRIEVSSDDGQAQRQSASGGTILLQSDLTTGQGITLGDTAALVSALNPNAPGPGGSITLSTMGADITISPSAVIEADRGTITIDQNDPVGSTPFITIDGATLTADTLTINGAGNVNIGSEVYATINANTLSITTPGDIQFYYNDQLNLNQFNVTSTNGGQLTLQFEDIVTLNGNATFQSTVLSGAMIDVGANVSFTDYEDYNNNSQTDFSLFQVTNLGQITTGGDVTVAISGNLTATGPGGTGNPFEPGDFVLNVQNTNGQIDTGGNASLTVNGNANVNGLAVYVQNYDETAHPAGHIGTGGNINVEIDGDLNANHYVDVFLNNRGGGSIDSGGNMTFTVNGDMTIGSDGGFSAEFIISNRYDDGGGNTSPSSIGSDVALNLLVSGDVSMAGDLFGSGISNRGGSTISGNATVMWEVDGNLSIQGNGNSSTAGGGSGEGWWILNDAINPTHDPGAHLTSPPGGTIDGNATLTMTVGGDVNIASDASIEISNQRDSGSTAANGGTITGNAAVNISAANFSVGGELDVDIYNHKSGSATGSGGSITGDATISFNVTNNFAMPGTDTNSFGEPGGAFFEILNFRGGASGSGGFIGGNASVDVEAGSIGSMATPLAELDADILNFNGGTINGNATVQIGTTGDLDAGFLYAGIDNVNGSIDGDATINMNVGGTATVTNDLTAEIFGNDPTGSAAINFNGGTYNVTGNFRSTIDGNGTITLNNVTASADTFKVGAFGTDAMLKIGGGSLSGTNEFKLYANGTNGSIEFSASVTLSSAAAQMILAANSVTIDDGVVVTISGPMSAKVYANVLNYSGASGGNGTTTGIFANGSAATISPATDSRGNAPAFDGPPSAPSSTKKSSAVARTNVQDSSRKTIASAASLSGASDRGHSFSSTNSLKQSAHSMGGKMTATTPTTTPLKVADSGQLLSMLDSATPNSNGKITINGSKRDGASSNPSNLSGSRLDRPGASHDRSPVANQISKASLAVLNRAQPSLR